ncbi:MAG: fluoride efflux transporter CrcB [Microbacteriaceae bacterium]|nr:fluoride efflux transporter CrcB [Microbacteriaceae bacterium]MCL2794773.1 fluoride efflux transporter CrcB [Microbacteriaceae bacterium]
MPEPSRGDVAPLPPLHLRPLPVLLVFVGGAIGTLARYLLSLALPSPDGLPLPTFFVNLVGAFLLGVLLEALLRRGPDAGWRQGARLFLGTGFMGGFTTYSSFAVETALLTDHARYVAGFGYAIVSLLLGVAATALGIWVSANLFPVPQPRSATDATALPPIGRPLDLPLDTPDATRPPGGAASAPRPSTGTPPSQPDGDPE